MSAVGRLTRLFGDPRAAQLDVETRTRLTNAGVVDEPVIKAAQAAERAKHATLWTQTPDMPVQLDREIRAARALPQLTNAELAARGETALRQSVTPIYGTLASRRDELPAIKAELHKSAALRDALSSRAGSAVPVLRAFQAAHDVAAASRAKAALASRRWTGR